MLNISNIDSLGTPLHTRGYRFDSDGSFTYHKPYEFMDGVGVEMEIEDYKRLLKIGEDLKRNNLNDNGRESLLQEASQIYRKYVSE